MANNLTQISATGDVATGSRKLLSVVLTPAAAAATLAVRDGSGGSVRLSLQAAANGSSAVWASPDSSGVPFWSSLHATIGGAGAAASFEFN